MQDTTLDLFLARVRPPWHQAASCRQPHHGPGSQPDWFASGRSAEGIVAISICRTCPVRGLCLRAAEDFGTGDQFGIWGGEAAGTRELRRTGYQRPSAA